MSRVYLYFAIIFSFCLLYGFEGYGQAIYTSVPGDNCLEENKFFDTCWEISGDCTVEDAIKEREFTPIVHDLVEGDVVIIRQVTREVIDEEGNIITETVLDEVFNAEGVKLEYEVGDEIIVYAGYKVNYADGRVHIAQPITPDPDPIYDIGGTEDCRIIFVVKDEVSVGNLHLKEHVTIHVNGGKLNIDNLTQDREISSTIVVDGGELIISGNLTPTAGRNDNDKTVLNIELVNEGAFRVIGKIDLKNNVHLNIEGDGSSKVITGELDIANRVEVNIKKLGGLEVLGDTHYRGTTSAINVEGHFDTKSLRVTGGGVTQFNAIGDATVNIKEDVHIGGDSQVTLGGDSIVEIGGDVTVTGSSGLNIINSNETSIRGDFNIEGTALVNLQDQSTVNVDGNVKIKGDSTLNASDGSTLIVKGGCDFDDEDCPGGLYVEGNAAKFNVSDTAGAYICGYRPEVNRDGDGNGVDVTLFCGGLNEGDESPCATYTGCMILPVVFSKIEADFNNQERHATISWATAKEWENSHFEIERSTDGTITFETIDQVSGRGWTDEVTEYSFIDENLPLTGGNVFYRLKQVDFNGKYDYSDITAVRVPNVHFTKGVWRAYPNPLVGSDFNLELVDLAQYHGEVVTLRILSSNISSNELTFHDLQELGQSAASFMATATSGLWIFEIQWGNSIERIKVMKQ